MQKSDKDDTIYPRVATTGADEQIAQAVAQFDRVLAGEETQGGLPLALSPELDREAAEFVQFLGLVENAWPRNVGGIEDGNQAKLLPNSVPGDTPADCTEPTASEFLVKPDDFASTQEELPSKFNRATPQDTGDEDPLLRLGRFRLRKQLGRGGYGNVYLAEDPNTRRQVALKVPRTDIVLTHDVQRRFVREARLAAALDHPGIVRVYDAGEIGVSCYIASEYCPGMDMAKWLAGRTQPIAQRSAAEIVIQLAEAVGHAHERGILHRDIKPSNVLLAVPQDLSAAAHNCQGDCASRQADQADSTRVDVETLGLKICDFGLAKLGSTDVNDGTKRNDSILTRTGEMLGTPSYMAPEQITANKVVTEATDIYALGVILYELLTGEVPFVGDNHVQIMHQVIEEPPQDPRILRREVSRELVAICFKCLEKEPTDRYASAAVLVDDLRRYLAGEEVIAKLPNLSQRLFTWALRHSRLVAGAIATVAFFVVVLLTVQSLNSRRLSAMNAELDGKKSELEVTNSSLLSTNDNLQRTQTELREHLYMADMWNASNAMTQYDNRTVRQLLEANIPTSGETDLRRTDWYLLNRLADPHTKRVLGKHEGYSDKVCVTLDAKRAYSVGQDGSIFGFDLETGQKIASWKYDAQINTVAVSDDGRYLLTGLTVLGSPVQTILVLDLETGEEKLRKRAHGHTIIASAFSPDGQTIATAGKSSKDRIKIHSLSGELIAELKSNLGRRSLVFTADGQSLMSLARTEDAGALRTTNLTNVQEFRDSLHRPWLVSFAVSHLANLVALDIAETSVQIMSMEGNSEQFQVEVPCKGRTTCIALSRSGGHLAVGTGDGQVIIWSVQELLNRQVDACHPRVISQESAIRSIAFVPGSWPTSLITSAADGSVTRWELNELCPWALEFKNRDSNSEPPDSPASSTAPVHGFVDMVPDPMEPGKYLALCLDGRLVRLDIGYTEKGSFTTICQTEARGVGKIAVHETDRIAAIMENNAVLIVSLTTGQIIKRVAALIPENVNNSLMFRDRRLYAVFKNMFWTLDLDQMKAQVKEAAPRSNTAGARCLLPVPNSSSILLMTCRKMFLINDGELSEIATDYVCADEGQVVRFSKNGKLLAIGDRNGQIDLLDVEQNWRLINKIRVHSHQVFDLQFLDNDRTIVSLCPDAGEIRFTDVATRKPLGRMPVSRETERFRFLEGSKSLLTYGVHSSYLWNYELPAFQQSAGPTAP